jgi:hypothetical protein
MSFKSKGMIFKNKGFNFKNKGLIQKIDNYCNGIWKPNKKEETTFLSSSLLKKVTGNNKSMNTGKLSEWYVGELLKSKGISFKSQPIIRYNLDKVNYGNSLKQGVVPSTQGMVTRSKSKLLSNKVNSKSKIFKNVLNIFNNKNVKNVVNTDINKKSRFIQPDFYIPEKDLFIEVKSRSYNCNGTASEKLDHIVRKYSKLEMTDDYKNSKLLIVCSAYELFEESTSELLNYNNKTSRSYIKDFVKLSKKYNILDWIPVSKIHKFL